MPGWELVGNEELESIQEIFSNGGGVFFRHGFDQIRNDCYKVKSFEEEFQKKMFSKGKCLAVSSGTAALRVALASLEINKGDEVITQAFTFVATTEAIIESGATPLCTQIDQSLNMCPSSLEKLISKKTKAVIVVHMLGVPANHKEIMAICSRHNIPLIEDTAWGCGAKLEEKFLGTIGDIGCYSFDNAKTITTGEGGMIACSNDELHSKAMAWHDHGHENNPSLPRWEDSRSSSGFNYRLSELQGAVGLAQLNKLDFIVNKQREIYSRLKEIILGINKNYSERYIHENSYISADAFIFFAESKDHAIKCREALLEEGVSTKILPEAMTWHFAGFWDHMPELMQGMKSNNLLDTFSPSYNILSKCVSLPINLKVDNQFFDSVEGALKKV